MADPCEPVDRLVTHMRGRMRSNDIQAMSSKAAGAGPQDAASLIERVISAGNCVGCGACAFADPSGFRMAMASSGAWIAQVSDPSPGRHQLEEMAQVCPMSGAGADETDLASELYGELPFDPRIGRYRDNMAVYVKKDDFRAAGSSGGFVSWLLSELLGTGAVDAVVHVRPVAAPRQDGLLYEYAVSLNQHEVVAGAKSRYYPIEMSQVLKLVSENDLRYAIVGVPCFIKAVRLLQKHGHIAQGKVPFCIGIVCGHLKSRYFGEYLAWQKGVAPADLTAIDFRHKLPEGPASSYGFKIAHRSNRAGPEVAAYPMRSVSGRDWGEGLFKIPACEYCDDVLAECADIAVGDAWLPEYVADPRGTNVVTVRNERLSRLIAESVGKGELWVSTISADAVAQSQSAGLRHRREGLSHRLARRIEAGLWVPKKRVEPRLAPSLLRRRLYDLREKIAVVSSGLFSQAKRDGQLSTFTDGMAPLLKKYRRTQKAERLVLRGPKKVGDILLRRLRSIVPGTQRPKGVTE